jgi:hypothetical protein
MRPISLHKGEITGYRNYACPDQDTCERQSVLDHIHNSIEYQQQFRTKMHRKISFL